MKRPLYLSMAALLLVCFMAGAQDGKEVLRVPAPTDYTTEKYVEDLNVIFARARNEAGGKETTE